MNDLLQFLTLIGVSTIVPGFVTWWLQRKAAKEDRADERSEETSAAVLAEGAKMREELWSQLAAANARNDALSQSRGELYQQKATLQGENEALQKQVNDVLGRLTVAQQQTDEARRLRDQDRERLGAKITERETTIAQLSARVFALEQDIARATGRELSRAADQPPVTAVILPALSAEGDPDAAS